MKLSDIEEVTKLRNYRRKAFDLIDAARSGVLDVSLQYCGGRYEVASTINVMCVREAIKAECQKMIDTWEFELKARGVEIDEPVA